MSNSITRVIKAVTSINSNFLGFSEAASNPKTFPKVALAVVVSSSVLGFGLLQIVDRKREANMKMVYSDGNEETMSHNESLVRAMIENAKSSSPRENLENAAMAQKNFMLVQFDKSVAEGNKDKEFLQQLAKRSEEIRNNKDRSN